MGDFGPLTLPHPLILNVRCCPSTPASFLGTWRGFKHLAKVALSFKLAVWSSLFGPWKAGERQRHPLIRHARPVRRRDVEPDHARVAVTRDGGDVVLAAP